MKRLAIYILLILPGCTKEKITTRPYPRVFTLPVSDITVSGATFHGNFVTMGGEVTDHGFVWSYNTFPTVGKSEQVSLGSATLPLPFEAKIERSLEAEKEYTVRAYAITKEFVVYGQYVVFTSQGSLPPVFTDFEPKLGTWLDTITLSGSNLSKESVVKFDGISATVVSATNTQAKVIVPVDYIGPEKTISVTFSGHTAVSTQTFKLRPPVITDFNPKQGIVNSVVMIAGTYFHPVQTQVKFNDLAATILTKSPTQITLKVPAGLPAGNTSLTVTSGAQSVVAGASFFNQLPVITAVTPNNGTYGDIITLSGTYFGPTIGANTVLFNTLPAQIISASTTEIKVKVPDDIAVPLSKITMAFSEQVSASVDFTLQPPTITTISPTRGTAGTRITITGTRFSHNYISVHIGGKTAPIISNTPTEIIAEIQYLSSHEPEVEVTSSGTSVTSPMKVRAPWAFSADYPYYNAFPKCLLQVQDRAFIILENSGRMFEYTAVSKSWTEKSAFPRNSIFPMFGFSIGNKGYAGNLLQSEFFEYDPLADTWTQKNDVPFSTGADLSGISSNTDGYVARIFYQEMWHYIPASDTWTQLTNFPSGFVMYGSVALGTEIYFFNTIASGTFWKYNTASTTWTDLGVVPFPGKALSAFTINGKIYVNASPTGTNDKLWIYNPATNTWSNDLIGYPLGNGTASYSVDDKGYVLTSDVLEYDPAY